MTPAVESDREIHPLYPGLRLSASEYFELEDDGFHYELIDGVMVMSPSPMIPHQAVVVQLILQLGRFLEDHPVGRLFPDIDVKLDKGLVYRPDLVFVRSGRLRKPLKRINVVPDLVVEIISPSSGLRDRRDKKKDYQRYGILEYWVIDPESASFTFYRRKGRSFVEVTTRAGRFISEAVPGFTLDLAAVRTVCRSV